MTDNSNHETNYDVLPDAAFAAIVDGQRHLPHHSQSAVKGTENGSVDIAMLKSAMAELRTTDLSPQMRSAARDHFVAHANALDMDDAEIAELIGDTIETKPTFQEQIESATSYLEAEDLLLTMLESGMSGECVAQAEAKMKQLLPSDEISDLFEGELIADKIVKGDDDYWHFTARVAQSDKVNKNKRLYPTEEFANNLPRVNRLCRAKRFTGRDGHASMFGTDKMSETVICYESFMLQGGDLIASGFLLPTQAGKDIAAIWEAGVNQQFSIVGYGNQEIVQAEDGSEYARITNYVLEGADPVRHGAANTRTLQMTRPKDSVTEPKLTDDAVVEAEDAITAEAIVEAESAVPQTEETHMGEEVKNETVEEKVEAQAPTIDVAAIKAEALAEAKEATKNIVADAMKAAREEAKLEAAKDAGIAKLAEGDEKIAKIVSRHFADCKTPEDVAAVIEEVTPLVEGLTKPKQVASVGIHVRNGSERERFMFDGSMKVIDRPETETEVMSALLEGLEDNGRDDASNRAWVMRKILDNYASTEPKYLRSMTRRGFAETASTTTALGTTLPMVLPIVRQMLPKLIPYELGAVVPIDRPVARVPFLDPQYDSGTGDGSNMDDSSVFDTGWADHAEEATKSKLSFQFTHTDVTAVEKAVYFNFTSALMQDMANIYNMDVEQTCLNAAVDYLALEVNYSFIETMVAGAGVTGDTFGTALPASGFENLNDWLAWGLPQSINSVSAKIAKKMYQRAGWILTGPTQATVFEATKSYEKSSGGPEDTFGMGITRTGTWQNLYDVYVVDWAEKISLKNKMLIGYKPSEWSRAAAVFCPYVPLYLSPVDPDAATNVIARSASTRNAYKVIQANGLGTLELTSAAGAALNYLD